jgi:primosomal protein N' (replication factor Y)
MELSVALVAVENVAYHFDIFYSYTVPVHLADKVKPGMRVMVPFGRSKSARRQGVVFGFTEFQQGIRYKDIITVLDDEPFFTEENLKIAEFLKDRTFCTYFEGIKVQFPAGYGYKTDVKYLAVATTEAQGLTDREKEVYEFMLTLEDFAEKGEIYSSLGLTKDCDIIDKLVNKKLVIKSYAAEKNMDDASVKTASAILTKDEAENVRLTPKQESVMSLLWEMGQLSVKDVCYYTGVTSAVISTLSKKGYIEVKDVSVYRTPQTQLTDNSAKKDIVLTANQQKAFDSLLEKYKNGGGVSLLYGITGSGKTSVFLSLIDCVIAENKQVIVMVPEISLTPQMMAIFKGRYGSEIAIFHSALSAGERRDEYKRVKEGKVKIVVGTRSAVFAPFENASSRTFCFDTLFLFIPR